MHFAGKDGLYPVLAASRTAASVHALKECLQAGASPSHRTDFASPKSPLREARTQHNLPGLRMLMRYDAKPDFQWHSFTDDWEEFKVDEFVFPKPSGAPSDVTMIEAKKQQAAASSLRKLSRARSANAKAPLD